MDNKAQAMLCLGFYLVTRIHPLKNPKIMLHA